MKIHLLAQFEMLPVPKNIEVVQDFGQVSITTTGSEVIGGSHMMVEGSERALKDWLRPFDGVWVGVGSPQMQEFEVMHIGE